MANTLSEDDLAQLEAEFDEALHEKLLLYTTRKIRTLRFRGVSAFTGTPLDELLLPKGQTVDDLVQEAYEKALSGTRKWNRELYPTAYKFFRGAVDSLVSNLVNSAENRKTVSQDLLDQDQEDGDDKPRKHEPLDSRRDSRQYAEDQDAERIMTEFREFVLPDNTLADLVDCFRAGIYKKKECAEYVGVDVKIVYAAQKRLDRKRSEFRKVHLEESETVTGRRKNRG